MISSCTWSSAQQQQKHVTRKALTTSSLIPYLHYKRGTRHSEKSAHVHWGHVNRVSLYFLATASRAVARTIRVWHGTTSQHIPKPKMMQRMSSSLLILKGSTPDLAMAEE